MKFKSLFIVLLFSIVNIQCKKKEMILLYDHYYFKMTDMTKKIMLIKKIEAGTKVQIIKKMETGEYEIEINNNEYKVSADQIGNSYIGKIKYVRPKVKLRMRRKPKAKSKKVYSLPENAPVKIISRDLKTVTIGKKKGSWVQVFYETKKLTGWVFEPYLTTKKPKLNPSVYDTKFKKMSRYNEDLFWLEDKDISTLYGSDRTPFEIKLYSKNKIWMYCDNSQNKNLNTYKNRSALKGVYSYWTSKNKIYMAVKGDLDSRTKGIKRKAKVIKGFRIWFSLELTSEFVERGTIYDKNENFHYYKLYSMSYDTDDKENVLGECFNLGKKKVKLQEDFRPSINGNSDWNIDKNSIENY